MASESKLFSPLKIGPYELSNRIVLAPLTRIRATEENVPVPMMEEYYTQRSSEPGTLLITEATFIHRRAGAGPFVPGIWNDDQIAGWRKIVDAVHRAGSVIFMQLWALGRTDDPEWMDKRATGDLISASDIPMNSDGVKPRPLTEQEIQEFIGLYAQAAKNAVLGAGFDGVEIHGANGYLVDQFIQDVSNQRTDQWGGSIENRSRFAIEITKAVAAAVGPEKTGIRLSPWSSFQGMKMSDPVPQFSNVMEQLKSLNIAYVHLVESRVSGNADVESTEKCDPLIALWGHSTPLLLAGGFTPKSAKTAVDEEYKDYNIAIVFGRHFISNPDLVYRIKNNIELTKYDRSTFYIPHKKEGYIDYPFSEQYKKEQPAGKA